MFKDCIIIQSPLVFSENLHKAMIRYTNFAVKQIPQSELLEPLYNYTIVPLDLCE